MDKAPTSDSALTQNEAPPPQPAEIDLTGMTLGDFKIRRRLGRGGMGQVYLAEQISLKREVALKTLRTDLSANKVSLERFDAEAKAVAKATHANIVQIYVIDKVLVQNQWIHYLALEYVDGRNLSELLEKKGSPDLLLGLSIMHQVGSALQRASELGIIHRDIKPENILISRQGEVKVADFGLSRCFADPNQPHNLTQTGVTMGTPLYMSPEQVELRPVDPRTDIYSFGVTCYHMFAGQPPFRGTSPFEIAVQHVQKEPPPLQETRPDLPIELCTLIQRMMAKKPEDRPQTSREIVREVGRLRDMLVGVASGTNFAVPGSVDHAVPAPAVLPGPRPIRAGPGRLRLWLLPAMTVLLALAAGLGGSYLYWNKPTKLLPAASEEDPFSDKAQFEKKEKELIALKEQHTPLTKPGDVKYLLDLGIFYLENGRLDKAEALFHQLKGQKELDDTRKLGMAMVLALRDKTDDSNAKFKDVLTRNKKEAPETIANFWRNYHPWRKMIATALLLNMTNIPTAFPQQLDFWRNVQVPAGKAAS